MQFNEKAILLSAESKPYDFNGNSGVSHTVRVSVLGEVYACKSTEEQVKQLQSLIRLEGDAVIELLSRKEKISLRLVSFVS